MIAGYDARAIKAAEEPVLADGAPLMGQAAFAIAVRIAALVHSRSGEVPGSRVLVLAGGGNNGGDGLYAAAQLRRRGVGVTVAVLHDRPHAGGLAEARAAGVQICDLGGRLSDTGAARLADLAGAADLWIDALAGIGVRGGLRGAPARAVAVLGQLRTGRQYDGPPESGFGAGAGRLPAGAANPAGRPRPPLVVAVDTPSGISADPGPVQGQVLSADLTLTIGVHKAGLLLPPGAAHAGRVEVLELPGLPPAAFTAHAPAIQRLSGADVAAIWPVPEPDDHKYSRGVVGVAAGSQRFPGAGVLCTAGALGIGVGMVRYLGSAPAAQHVLGAYPEVVTDPGRVQTIVVGSGLGEGSELEAALDHARQVHGWTGATDADLARPGPEQGAGVWDAGALIHLPQDTGVVSRQRIVVTPHAGELADLLRRRGVEVDRDQVEADPWRWARRASEVTGATVLLKGAITVVAGPDGTGYAQENGTNWMATAGTGDVLAGVLGAMLAQAAPAAATTTIAAAAALVHGRAGQLASAGGPLRAGALAAAIPAAVRSVLTEGGALSADRG